MTAYLIHGRRMTPNPDRARHGPTGPLACGSGPSGPWRHTHPRSTPV